MYTVLHPVIFVQDLKIIPTSVMTPTVCMSETTFLNMKNDSEVPGKVEIVKMVQ